jgi:hypothetical protein
MTAISATLEAEVEEPYSEASTDESRRLYLKNKLKAERTGESGSSNRVLA